MIESAGCFTNGITSLRKKARLIEVLKFSVDEPTEFPYCNLKLAGSQNESFALTAIFFITGEDQNAKKN